MIDKERFCEELMQNINNKIKLHMMTNTLLEENKTYEQGIMDGSLLAINSMAEILAKMVDEAKEDENEI